MNSKINLAAYFRRIGFESKPAVDIETLRALQELHTQAIPFENLNPLLGLPILLDIKSLQKKLLADKRGGYCFEQNILFQHVLETIGFKVKGLAARVIEGGVEGHISPRTHMLLMVTVDKVLFVADVGFGGMTPTSPLLLDANGMQDTTLEPFRLDRDGDNYILQANVDDNWKSLYRFDLEEQFLTDYEVANWYTSANPASHFLSNLLVSRTAHDRRYTLRNNQFSIHHVKKGTQKRLIDTATEIRKVLKDSFGLSLTSEAGLNAKLEDIIYQKKPDGT